MNQADFEKEFMNNREHVCVLPKKKCKMGIILLLCVPVIEIIILGIIGLLNQSGLDPEQTIMIFPIVSPIIAGFLVAGIVQLVQGLRGGRGTGLKKLSQTVERCPELYEVFGINSEVSPLTSIILNRVLYRALPDKDGVRDEFSSETTIHCNGISIPAEVVTNTESKHTQNAFSIEIATTSLKIYLSLRRLMEDLKLYQLHSSIYNKLNYEIGNYALISSNGKNSLFCSAKDLNLELVKDAVEVLCHRLNLSIKELGLGSYTASRTSTDVFAMGSIAFVATIGLLTLAENAGNAYSAKSAEKAFEEASMVQVYNNMVLAYFEKNGINPAYISSRKTDKTIIQNFNPIFEQKQKKRNFALIISTIVAVTGFVLIPWVAMLGLAMVIGGIVALVVRNRKLKEDEGRRRSEQRLSNMPTATFIEELSKN